MIVKLKKEYVDEVVNVHILAFPESQSTKFGSEFLKSYYLGAVFSPNTTSFLWIEENRVAGFIFGGTNKQKLSRQIMMRSKARLVKVVLTNILRNPVISIKRFGSYLIHYILPGGDTFYADDTSSLDSIAVLKEYRGKGIADALMLAFLDELRSNGLSACRLGVLEDNMAARKFYERSGFEQVNQEGTSYIYFFDEKYRVGNPKNTNELNG